MAAITVVDNGNGTVTFTVAGAVGTVDIKTAPWSGGFVNASWTLSATRSGNGTVNATLAPGLYNAYAENAGAASDFIGFRVTSGEESFGMQIRNAVKAKLQALSLSGIASGSIISPLKLPLKPKTMTLPGILITLVGENDNFEGGATNERDDVDYTVQLVLVSVGSKDNDNASEMAQHDLWRQQIAKAFRNQPLPGCGAYRCIVERRTIYSAADFQQSYDTHAILLHLVRRESRGVT